MSLLSSRLDPVEWHPPDPPPMEGPLAQDRALADCEVVADVEGPEDVAFDGDGRLYTGAEDGTVHRTVEPVTPGTTHADLETHAQVPGRPLAVEFDGEALLVASIEAGLLSVASDGEVTTLADRAGGRDVVFADDIHVADDGTVYFTDASSHPVYQDELFELRDTGRLLAYHPDSGETTVELGDLGFANGLVPGPDGDSLLINETSRYRITRYWTDGEREGERTFFAENLPGYPDNIDVGADGSHWVAIPALRTSLLDRIHHYPWLIRQVGRLPEWVMASISPAEYGLVLELDADGDVVDALHDPSGEVHYVTSATPYEGDLYLGTLVGDCVRRYPLD